MTLLRPSLSNGALGFVGLVALALSASLLGDQVTSAGATDASPIGSGGGTARSAAMAGAADAFSIEPSALFWNPAALALQPNQELGFHHQSWLGGVNQEGLLYGQPLGSLGGAAVALSYANWGT